MNEMLNRKIVPLTPPGAIVDNAAFTTNEVDSQGYDQVIINVLFGAMDIAMAGLKVQESDETGTNFSDVPGCVVGTSTKDDGTASTLPSATADNTLRQFVIPKTGGRKRFFDLVATGGDGTAGTYMTAWAELCMAKDAPRTAVEALGTGGERFFAQ